jgi:hypothetical protein
MDLAERNHVEEKNRGSGLLVSLGNNNEEDLNNLVPKVANSITSS